MVTAEYIFMSCIPGIVSNSQSHLCFKLDSFSSGFSLLFPWLLVKFMFVSYVSDILRLLTDIHEVLPADKNPRINDVVVEIFRLCISDIVHLHVHLTASVSMVRLVIIRLKA